MISSMSTSSLISISNTNELLSLMNISWKATKLLYFSLYCVYIWSIKSGLVKRVNLLIKLSLSKYSILNNIVSESEFINSGNYWIVLDTASNNGWLSNIRGFSHALMNYEGSWSFINLWTYSPNQSQFFEKSLNSGLLLTNDTYLCICLKW